MHSPLRRSHKQWMSTILCSAITILLSLDSITVTAQTSSTPSPSSSPTTLPPPSPDAGPTPVTGAASARASTRFYIIGGLPSTLNNTLPLSQFFSLDLTLAWNTTTPSRTKLASGPKQRIFPATFSKNQKSLIVFRAGEPNYIRRYIVASGNWSPSTVNLTYGFREGLGAVTDPNTGLVYVARGYTDINERSVDVYNVDRDAISELPLPPATSFLAQRTYYGNVWCQPRKSILYFGGYALETQPAPISPDITEFVPSSQTWSTMKTFGEPPSLRADHCMTINEDGTRMVVYGGSPNDKSQMSGEIFMFNTGTQTWTKGISGEPRAYATCTIAGNQLLIWGGMTADRTVASGDVMIYNMENDKWVTSYSPPAWYLNPSATTTTSGSDPSMQASGRNDGSGGNVGAIVGGVVGGLVVVAGVILFFFRRRQERRRLNARATVVNDHPKSYPVNNNDNTSAVEKLHTAGYGAPQDTSRKEDKEEIQTLRAQLHEQKEQQEALQRQLDEIKNQQNQDAVYGYQPPIYYPPGTSSLVPTQPEIFQPFPTEGPVIYDPSTPPPPIPPRIPVTTKFCSGDVSATVSGTLPFSQSSILVRSPEGLIQSEQQQSTELYQDIDRDGTGTRPNNPHTPVTNSGRPHTIIP